MEKNNEENNKENINNNKTEIKKTEKSSSFLSDLKDFSFDTIKIVVISLVVIIGIRTFVMQPFFVNGQSMEPNFYDGDYLIVNEISYRFDNPQRGDVIIFHYPNDPRQFFIKRVIGLPGEKIEIKNSKITIYNKENPDGLVLDEFYLPKTAVIIKDYSQELKNDEYYVLGDNRTASSDSRVWGVLEKRYIVGKTWIRAWPFGNFSIFEGVEY
ncbi:MAG: signal peptidase I [Patescibacteria group bacterium]|nr:signal peptidase I [Patescibacteria group bacterium]